MAKIGIILGKDERIFDKGYCEGIVPLFILHPFEYHLLYELKCYLFIVSSNAIISCLPIV